MQANRPRARPGIILQLVAIGAVEPSVLAWLADQLPQRFQGRILQVEQGRIAFPLLRTALGPPYPAEAILDGFACISSTPYPTHLLALLDHDLYAPGLNFVFGLAQPAQRRAIVALPRLREKWYGRSEDSGLFRARLLKEAAYELGHTFGLEHCARPECVMYFSNTLEDTDQKAWDLCQDCATRL